MTPVNEVTLNYGTLMYASDRILNAFEHSYPFEAKPSDDLHSVVRTIYALTHKSVVVDTGVIRKFWNERLAAGVWSVLATYANERNYAGLVTMLQDLFE
jgi:hypothetical protein